VSLIVLAAVALERLAKARQARRARSGDSARPVPAPN
jgi:hypothetical protein